MSNPGFLDGRFAIVTREWFDRAQEVMQGKHGCPFCGSKREPFRSTNGPSIEAGVNTVGCLDCGKWFD